MDRQVLNKIKLDLPKHPHVYENQKPHVLQTTPDNSNAIEFFYNHSNASFQSNDKNDSTDLLCLSDEDSSLFELAPVYTCFPSISKLKKTKQVLLEVNTMYVNWKVSELVLNKYRLACSDMPHQTAKRIKDTITSSSVDTFTVIKNRKGESFNILGLEEADFETLSKKPLLSAEKKDLTSKMMSSLNTSIQQLISEKENLKGMFGSHCLKITPADTALSEERVHQAQINDQLKLKIDQGYDFLVSHNEIIKQLAHLEVNAVQQLQNTSYLSLKDKARHLCNNLRVLKCKMDQINLADVNHTRSMNRSGERLKTSVDSMSEKRKSLLKTLEKYERKEKASKTFSDIVAEYAKTKRQLHHKLQTLKVLNEPDKSFS